jgi:uncharacterized membrane protein YdjX (TVP38/TMEM64 family)
LMETDSPKAASWRRFLPFAILLVGLVAFFALGLHRYVSFETVARYRILLLSWVEAHPVMAPMAFIAAFALTIACLIPSGVIFAVTGGFLFGTLLGGICTVIGAIVGITVVFLAARTAFRDMLSARMGPTLRRMEEGFRRDAFSYLLVLRLIPVLPFFVVNIVPALLGVPFRTYFIASTLGFVPTIFVLASIGRGLGAVFDAGGTPDAGILLEPEIFLPLLGLAALALIPVVYRRFRKEAG